MTHNEKLEPCLLVIFGATGDLTHRKLYPALFNLYREGMLPANFGVVSIGRRDKNTEMIHQDILQSISSYSREQVQSNEESEKFLELFSYYRLDINDSQGYQDLKEHLETLDQHYHTKGNRVFFLAVAPEYFALIAREIEQHNMAVNDGHTWQRVVIEKPFGRDLSTAKELNAEIRSTFTEDNIYRIDHYLGKEMAQNIMVLRFANTLFEPLWNSKYIDHVQISLCETVGVEGRGPYYEQAGALRDMVQNHMLQLLSLIAMEPPVDLETESVRDEKVKVLRSLKIEQDSIVYGQYGEGSWQGQVLRSYRDEERVSPDSAVETFVALKASVENFRWAGVPFYLRTGKRLPRKFSEIIIKFKKLPGVLYFKNGQLDSNLLVIRVQPDEGIYLQFNAKRPGTEHTIVPVTMDFKQHCIEGFNSPEAYERLLYDVVRGDSTLFTRWDEVEYSWKFVDAIANWRNQKTESTPIYPSGTWGPIQAELLIRNDGREWLYL